MSRFSDNRRSGPAGSQRTAAERDAARGERERRRAEGASEEIPAGPVEPRVPVQPQAQQQQSESPTQASDQHTDIRTEEHALIEPDTHSDDQPPQPEPVAIPSRHPARSEIRQRLLQQRSSRRRGEGGAHKGLTPARTGALVALILALALVWFLLSLLQPFHGSGHGRVIVEIPKGSGSSQIGSILERDGVVSSSFFFEARALLEGKRSDLHSGRFR